MVAVVFVLSADVALTIATPASTTQPYGLMWFLKYVDSLYHVGDTMKVEKYVE